MFWNKKRHKAFETENKIQTLTDQVEEMEETLKNKDSIITMLMTVREELTSRVHELELSTKSQSSVKDVRAPLEIKKSDFKLTDEEKWKMESKVLRKNNNELQVQNKKLEDTNSEHEIKILALSREIRDLESQIKSMSTTHTQVSKKKSPVPEEPYDEKDLPKDPKVRARVLGREVRKKDAEIKLQQKEIKDLQKSLMEKQQQITALQMKAESVNASAAKTILFHNNEIKKVQSKEEQTRDERRTKDEEWKRKDAELINLRKVVASNDQAKLCLQQQEKIKELEKLCFDLKKKALDERAAASDKINRLSGDLENVNKSLQTKDRRIEKLIAVEQQYQELISLGDVKQMGGTIKELEKARKEAEAENEKTADDLKKLKTSFETIQVEVNNKAVKIDQLTKEVNTSSDTIREQKKKIASVRKELEQSQTVQIGLRNEIIQLKSAKDVSEVLEEQKKKLKAQAQTVIRIKIEEMEDLKIEHERAVEGLKQKHAEELKKHDQLLQKKLENEKNISKDAREAAQNAALNEQKAVELANLNAEETRKRLEVKIDQLKGEHEEKLRKTKEDLKVIRETNVKAIKKLKDHHESVLNGLKVEFKAAQSGNESKVMAIMEKEREKHEKELQEHQKTAKERFSKMEKDLRSRIDILNAQSLKKDEQMRLLETNASQAMQNKAAESEAQLKLQISQNNTRIETLREDYESQLEAAVTECRIVTAKMEEKHEHEMQSMKEKTEKLKAAHKLKIMELRDGFEEEKQELRKSHSKKLTNLITQLSKEREEALKKTHDIMKKHQDEMVALAETHQTEMKSVTSKLSQTKQQLSASHHEELERSKAEITVRMETKIKELKERCVARESEASNQLLAKDSKIKSLECDLEREKRLRSIEIEDLMKSSQRAKVTLEEESKRAAERQEQTLQATLLRHTEELEAQTKRHRAREEDLDDQWKKKLEQHIDNNQKSLEKRHASALAQLIEGHQKRETKLMEEAKEREKKLNLQVSESESKFQALAKEKEMSDKLAQEAEEKKESLLTKITDLKILLETAEEKIKDLEEDDTATKAEESRANEAKARAIAEADARETHKNFLIMKGKFEAIEEINSELTARVSNLKKAEKDERDNFKKEVAKLRKQAAHARSASATNLQAMLALQTNAAKSLEWSVVDSDTKLSWIKGIKLHELTIVSTDVPRLSQLEDAHLVVTVVDANGNPMGRSSRTTVMTGGVQIISGDKPESKDGPFVFIEIKHSKRKSKSFVKISTRGFAFYDMFDGKSNQDVIVYEKPTELTRDASKLKSRSKLGKMKVSIKKKESLESI